MINKNTIYAFIATITILFFGITYFILFIHPQHMQSKFLLPLLCCDVIFVLSLIFIVMRRLIKTLRYKKINKKSNFQKQIIVLFTGTTIFPATCVFIFAISFFNIGIERLFKEPVKDAIENANTIAYFYIDEMKRSVSNYLASISKQFTAIIDDISYSDNIKNILKNEIHLIDASAIIFQTFHNNVEYIIAESDMTMSLKYEKIPHESLFLKNGEVITWETDSAIIAITAIDQDTNTYMMIAKNIDPIVLAHKFKIDYATKEYTTLASQRNVLKMTFISLFASIVIFMLLIVVLFGIIFAKRTTRPITKLINAAKSIKLDQTINIISYSKAGNELDTLISAFNNMVLELEKQKKALIISNRQNAWRDIARKIAHEIKNPLTPIQLAAERIKNKYIKEIQSDPEIFLSCIEVIIRQVKCIERLVSEFSNFARMPAPDLAKTDIVQLVKDIIFMHKDFASIANFTINTNQDKIICYIDQHQFGQLFINIFQNAVNAITEHCKNGNIYVNIIKQNNMCQITVEDTGPGFSQQALDHALDPYFTTREEGNGLGLAIAYKIAIEHGGTIEIKNSQQYGGAYVAVYIPLSIE